ncbi:hypothetical protein MKJ04_20980 [Pontibacter sp. E15-1]|uniref:hypothetical protein n=1 Tax=Pontibacter sp. E15-1 TaxID=2919918 RepID=UPI001F4F7234|nr:hypothetical protein [Pontibacter sp. E15-1]MCJ8167328.1 hypothetical protein [Pontibacter sp. E15-1]
MNKLILLLGMLCLGTAAQAQDTLRLPSLLSLHVGTALPMGSFSGSSFDKESPAFAGEGILLQLTYTHPITSHLALGATAGFRANPFLQEKFQIPGDNLVQAIESTPWKTGYALANVQVQVPLGEEGGFYLRGGVGGALNRAASLRVLTPYGTITRDAETSLSIAYGASSGFYSVVSNLVLGFEVSLMATRADLTPINPTGSTEKYRQPLHSANLSLGIGYRL